MRRGTRWRVHQGYSVTRHVFHANYLPIACRNIGCFIPSTSDSSLRQGNSIARDKDMEDLRHVKCEKIAIMTDAMSLCRASLSGRLMRCRMDPPQLLASGKDDGRAADAGADGLGLTRQFTFYARAWSSSSEVGYTFQQHEHCLLR